MKHDRNSDEWDTVEIVALLVGGTFGLILFAHFVVTIANAIPT